MLAATEPGRYLHSGRLEGFFDPAGAGQIEVSGKNFEGAKINYEGNLALSWQTLWAGPLLADRILGATSETKESPRSKEACRDVSNCLPELLAANAELWAGRRGYLYADSASSAGKYLELIGGQFEAWSVSYNKRTGPLEKKAAELPEWAWSAEEKTQWNDGTAHVAQYASFKYQPGGCEPPQNFAVVRHKRADGEFFWRYVPRLRDGSADRGDRSETGARASSAQRGQGASVQRSVERFGFPPSALRAVEGQPGVLRAGGFCLQRAAGAQADPPAGERGAQAGADADPAPAVAAGGAQAARMVRILGVGACLGCSEQPRLSRT